MAISLATTAVGTWTPVTTNGGTVSIPFPSGYTKTVGDLMVLICGGWSGTTTLPTAATGFTNKTSSVRTPTAGNNIIIYTQYKQVASTSEAVPTLTVPANWSSTNNTWNLGGFMLVFRQHDIVTPFDVADTTGNSGAATSVSGPTIVTSSASTAVISCAITGDNNQTTASGTGWTQRAGGTTYSSATIGLESFVAATQIFTTSGSKTGPTFTQAANGPDSWATLTVAIRGATVPGTPSSVAASITGSTTATVTWTAPSTGNAYGGITSYTTEYSTNGTVWTSAGTGSSPKSVTGLTPNTPYYFRVTATNAVGNSTPGSTSPTTYTTQFADTPSNITTTLSNITSSSIPLSWTAPSGTGTTSYTVQYSKNGGASWTTAGNPATNSTTVTGLDIYSSYIFRVSATNATQTSAYSSNSADFVTDTDGQIMWGPVIS